MIHLHQIPPQLIVATTLLVDGPIGANGCRIPGALDPTIADRVVELLERHGLVDVPGDPSTLTAGFPPPDPTTKVG